jgi:hypothetical protein
MTGQIWASKPSQMPTLEPPQKARLKPPQMPPLEPPLLQRSITITTTPIAFLGCDAATSGSDLLEAP